MNIRNEIDAAALQVLKETPNGVRFSELWRRVQSTLPHLNQNTVFTTVSTLEARRPKEVTRPARGLYRLALFTDGHDVPTLVPNKTREEHFYKPFAEWLVGELEECTKAIALGGNLFRDKWGTPDVVGIREPRKSDIIKFETEIVSAEIKLDVAGLITAFGQACAYRLFSHKSYLVVPSTSMEADVARLDVLCRIFGVGLILFNSADCNDPNFEIRARAISHNPDMFYVNQCMKLVEDQLFA